MDQTGRGESVKATGGFDAFISHSHAVEGRLAARLQAALERFAKAWYQRRALRIFRDTTNLSASPDLWKDVASALDRSRHLVLLASPEAARSRWVRSEVEHWLASKTAQSILMVVTGGDLRWKEDLQDFDWRQTDAIPRSLGGAFQREPLWVDLRWAREPSSQLSMREPRFAQAVLSLSAALTGRSMDELGGESVRQHRRTLWMAWTAASAIGVLATAASGMAFLASRSADEATVRERESKVRESERLAEAARIELSNGDAVDAMQLALAALPQRFDVKQSWKPWAARGPDRPISPEATGILVEALQRNREWFHSGDMGAQRADERIVTGGFPDDASFFAVTRSGKYRVWTGATKMERPFVTGPSGAVETAFVGNGGRAAVYVNESREIWFWSPSGDFPPRRLAVSLKKGDGWQDTVDAILDGQSPRILVVKADGPSILFDPAANETLATLPRSGPFERPRLIRLAERNYVLVKGARGRRFLDATTGRPVSAPMRIPEGLDSIQVSDDASVMLASSVAQGGVLWTRGTARSKFEVRFNLELRTREHLALSPNGAMLAKKRQDQVSIELAPARSRLRVELLSTGLPIGDMQFDRTGRRLLAVLDDGSMAVWSAAVEGWSPGIRIAPAPAYDGAYSHDGRHLLVGNVRLANDHMQGCVAVWDAQSRRLEMTLDIPDRRWVRHVQISPDDSRILALDTSGRLHVWDRASSERLYSIGSDEARIEQARFARRGVDLWTLDSDGKLRYRSAALGSILQQMDIDVDGVKSMDVDDEGTTIVVGYEAKSPVVITTSTAPWTVVASPAGKQQPQVAVARDGTKLALGGHDGSITVFRSLPLPDHPESVRYTGLRSPLEAVTFSSQGDRLAAVTTVGDIGLWNSDQTDPWAVLRYAAARVYGLAFSPDGNQLTFFTHDGLAISVDVPRRHEDLVARARTIVTRPLSTELQRRFGVDARR